MKIGPFKPCEFFDSLKVNKSMCHLNDIYPLRDSLDHVYTASSELDQDCLPILNISQPNDRQGDFIFEINRFLQLLVSTETLNHLHY